MKVGDLVKVITVEMQPVGIITKVVRYDNQRDGIHVRRKYYVTLSQYDFVDKCMRQWGPLPFIEPQLEVISESS
jgi:hypothetical protein